MSSPARRCRLETVAMSPAIRTSPPLEKRKVPGIGGGERSGDGELSGIRAPDGQVLGEYPVELGIRQSDRAKAVRDAADIDRPPGRRTRQRDETGDPGRGNARIVLDQDAVGVYDNA